MEKRIFYCVDCQVDFIEPEGKLPIPNAIKIKPNLKLLTEYAKQKNIKVISSMDWHKTDSKELSDQPDYINTFPPHCMENSEGAQLIQEVSFAPENPFVVSWFTESIEFPKIHEYRNIVILKDAFDVFEGNKFSLPIINNLGVPMNERPEFIIYGVVTEICVDKVVIGLTKRGYTVTVITDAIMELNTQKKNEVIENWSKYGVIFKTTKDIIV